MDNYYTLPHALQNIIFEYVKTSFYGIIDVNREEFWEYNNKIIRLKDNTFAIIKNIPMYGYQKYQKDLKLNWDSYQTFDIDTYLIGLKSYNYKTENINMCKYMISSDIYVYYVYNKEKLRRSCKFGISWNNYIENMTD